MSCLPDDLLIPGFSWGCTFCWWEGSNSRTNWLCVVCAACGFMLRVKVTRCQSGLVRLLIISPVKNQVLSVTMWSFYLTCGRQVPYVSFLTASFQSLLSSRLHLVEHCLSSTAWLWSIHPVDPQLPVGLELPACLCDIQEVLSSRTSRVLNLNIKRGINRANAQFISFHVFSDFKMHTVYMQLHVGVRMYHVEQMHIMCIYIHVHCYSPLFPVLLLLYTVQSSVSLKKTWTKKNKKKL